MSTTSVLPTALPAPAERGGYANCLSAACGHAVAMMLRRQRVILVAIICMLPVLLPLAIGFLSASDFADNGRQQFVRIAETIYLGVLTPLLALFFATMLIGEEAEGQTMPYVLTRAIPRSAWVLGRFLAYVLVTGFIVCVAMGLTYTACTTLENLGWRMAELRMLSHYLAATVLGLVAYGALTAFLGAISRRAILFGIALIYGWQTLALLAPGLLANLTIKYYVNKLIPSEAIVDSALRHTGDALSQLEIFNREIFLKEAAWSVLILMCITAVFLALTVLTVRMRQYASVKVSGS